MGRRLALAERAFLRTSLARGRRTSGDSFRAMLPLLAQRLCLLARGPQCLLCFLDQRPRGFEPAFRRPHTSPRDFHLPCVERGAAVGRARCLRGVGLAGLLHWSVDDEWGLAGRMRLRAESIHAARSHIRVTIIASRAIVGMLHFESRPGERRIARRREPVRRRDPAPGCQGADATRSASCPDGLETKIRRSRARDQSFRRGVEPPPEFQQGDGRRRSSKGG